MRVLTHTEVIELAKRKDAGDRQAREKLILHNLRLVQKLARQYSWQSEGVEREGTLPYDDLVQEGVTGLIRAVDKYDWKRGTRFSTYASWWVEQSLRRALTGRSRSIRMPDRRYQEMWRVERARAAFSRDGVQQPSDADLAARSGVDVEMVIELKSRPHAGPSMDAIVGEGGATFGELIADDDNEDVHETAARTELADVLRYEVGQLPVHDRMVLAHRFGLEGMSVMTKDDLADMMGISRSEVSEIERRAMKTLSANERLRSFAAQTA